jgi:hypothetical protein
MKTVLRNSGGARRFFLRARPFALEIGHFCGPER